MQGPQILIPMEAEVFWRQMRSIIADVLDKRDLKTRGHGGDPAPRLLKVKDVCELFHVSKPTVYEWMRTGQLRSVKIDSRRFFLASDLNALIKKNRVV
jgi:excisionase family DNA binding protein